MDVTGAVINYLKADPRLYAALVSGLTAVTDFGTTAPSTTTITMVTDQTMLYPVGSVIGVTVAGVLKFGTVKTITSSLLTLTEAILTTGAGAITTLGYARVYRADFPSFQQLPAVMVTKVDDLRGNHSSTTKYSAARVQVTSYAKTDSAADEVSELVADALDTLVNTNIAGLRIISCFDAGTVPDSSPKTPLYIYHRDFRITYSVRL